MNFLYVDGSSYWDQLKISRWSSSGLPANASELAVLVPVPWSPVDVLPHALSSIRPPIPSAERRDSG